MIKAIYLDAGGVIIDESQFENSKAEMITRILNKHIEYTITDYWRDTEEAVYRFVSSTYEYVFCKNIKDIDICKMRYKEFKTEWRNSGWQYKTMEYLENMLQVLSEKYMIGILGQYDETLKEFLKSKQLDKYFSFMETQEKYSITKPDPRYYIEVLKVAKLNPSDCLMIGDRIDKDIYPANVIGMKNIRIRTGLHRNQDPRIFIEIPNYTIKTLKEVDLDLIKRIEENSIVINPFLWDQENLTIAST